MAELEPVLLQGSTISRATMHNLEYINEQKIAIGSIVIIEKGGDVIPKVLGVEVTEEKKKEAEEKRKSEEIKQKLADNSEEEKNKTEEDKKGKKKRRKKEEKDSEQGKNRCKELIIETEVNKVEESVDHEALNMEALSEDEGGSLTKI